MSKKEIVKYESFREFYPFYLTEHQHPVNRTLHFCGTTISIILLLVLLVLGYWKVFYLCIIPGYFFAWIGHFFFEKNRPATFTYPFYSFLGDLRMWSELIRGKLSFNPKKSSWKPWTGKKS